MKFKTYKEENNEFCFFQTVTMMTKNAHRHAFDSYCLFPGDFIKFQRMDVFKSDAMPFYLGGGLGWIGGDIAKFYSIWKWLNQSLYPI